MKKFIYSLEKNKDKIALLVNPSRASWDRYLPFSVFYPIGNIPNRSMYKQIFQLRKKV